MITISWTGRVGEPAGPGAAKRDDVWKLLLVKAEDPVGYVPAITECRILERYDDGFLREIVRNGEIIVQRVSSEPQRRIEFRHVGDPDVAYIANVLGEDEDGFLTFTIEVGLTADGQAKAVSESAFLRATDDYYESTIPPILTALAPLATHGR